MSIRSKRGKKAQAQIIVTVLIILLVIVIVAIVSTFVIRTVREGAQEAEVLATISDLSIEEIEIVDGFAKVSVKKGPKEGTAGKINIVLRSEEESQIATIDSNLKPLETKTFLILLEFFNPTTVEIYPVIEVAGEERVGNKADFVKEGDRNFNNQGFGSLVAYWTFDEGSGAVANDGVGSMDLEVKSLTEWVDGKFGKAVKIPDTATLSCTSQQVGLVTTTIPAEVANLPQESFSISWWDNVPDTGVQGSKFNLASVNVVGCGRCSIWNRMGFGVLIRDVTNLESATIPYTQSSINEWHYFVYYFDYPNRKTGLYQDGALVVEKTLATGDYGTISTWFSIGVYNTPACTHPIPGAMFDDFRIYSKKLSTEEINALYQQGV